MEKSYAKYTFWGVVLVLVLGALVWLNLLKMQQEDVGRRALRTPVERLVGHWQLYSRSELPSYELFFGPVDESGRGSHTMLDEIQDQILLTGHYNVLPDTQNNLSVGVRINLGAQINRKVTVIINRDGLQADYLYESAGEEYRQKMKYLGPETKYDPQR